MVKAKAAVFHETDKPMTIETFHLGAPQSGWALIKMEASGVCGTDVHQFKGRIATQTPIVLGHEMAGVVAEIADSDSEKFGVKKGDHVLTSVAVPCGECALCKMGGEANCLNFGCTYVHNPYEAPHLFGGYSEYAYFPAGNLFKVPAGLPIKTAAVFACGGPTVLNAFKPVTASGFANITTAVVQGLGPVGMFALLYLKLNGVKNIVVINKSFDPIRKDIASCLGATHFLCLDDTTPQERLDAVMELTGGIGADLAVEASGSKYAFPEGLDLLRNRGTYLVPGQYSITDGVMVRPELITTKALSVLGASQYSAREVRQYLDLLAAHPEVWGAVDKVCTHTFTVGEANEAILKQQMSDSVKILLVPEK